MASNFCNKWFGLNFNRGKALDKENMITSSRTRVELSAVKLLMSKEAGRGGKHPLKITSSGKGLFKKRVEGYNKLMSKDGESPSTRIIITRRGGIKEGKLLSVGSNKQIYGKE